MRYRFIVPAVMLVMFLSSCKKDKGSDPDPTPTPGAPTAIEILTDSVYLYSKEVYLWQEKIPAYDAFNPRQYKASTAITSAENVMNAFKKLQPLDRFSFVTTTEESDGLQTGEDKDYGFFIKAAAADRVEPIDSVYWYVNYVYNQSTAGQNGVQRGWYISKINNSPITYTQASINTLNEVFFGTTTSASFEFTKPDNTTKTVTLSKTSFTANSVLYRGVLTAGAKKAGYLVFNQFFGQPSRTELAEAFNYFTSQGINELIVDLRYNRGGSTETQDTLANLIAPSSANTQTMYQYIFNSTLQANQHTLIRKRLGYGNSFTAAANTVKYQKAGALNLPRVFFIVSRSSASASELVINNLKPYMDVKLIGDTTYGKPVGFFPIPVNPNLALYPISFKTVNSQGNAEYYAGFAPDKLAADGVNRNWGDVNEPSLAFALRYISTGSFARTTTDKTAELQLKSLGETKWSDKKLNEGKFSGMYLERK